MTITKPNTQQIIVGVSLFIAFIALFLPWASFLGESANGLDWTRGVFAFLLVLMAMAAWASQLFIASLPPNLQMAAMGAPILIAAISTLAFLLVFTVLFSEVFDYLNRGVGLWLEIIALLVVIAVSAIQSKPLLEAAKAMKAAQQTPPPPAPPAPPVPPQDPQV